MATLAAGRGSRAWFHVCHVVHAADRTARPCGALRGGTSGARSARQAAPPLSVSSRPTRCWRWRAKPDFEMCGMCQPPRLAEQYFAGRTDGLRPPDNSKSCLVATA